MNLPPENSCLDPNEILKAPIPFQCSLASAFPEPFLVQVEGSGGVTFALYPVRYPAHVAYAADRRRIGLDWRRSETIPTCGFGRRKAEAAKRPSCACALRMNDVPPSLTPSLPPLSLSRSAAAETSRAI